MMKKITLLIVSLLLLTGGAMAQPDALPDGAGTLKAEGDNLKAVYTQTERWVINNGRRAEEINLTSGGKVLQCGIDGDLKTIYQGETIDVSKMTNLHLDIYPTKVNENGVLGIFVFSNGVPSGWRGIEKSGITADKWNSIDIDLSKYPSNPLSPITALAISGGVSVKDENNAGSGFKPHPNETKIYVANAYFYAYADDSKPTLTTSVKNTTSNSITLHAKAVKAKETVGEEITYTVTYNDKNKTFIAQSGVETDLIIDGLESETEYNFTIKATDANGNSSKEQSQTVKTLKESASQPTSIPDLKTGYGEITELYTKGENKNGYFWDSWNSSAVGRDIEIGNDKAFLIENFTYYGSQFTKVDGTGMTLHVDVYPLQDIDLGIIPVTNDGVSNVDRYGQTFSLKRGEWHELELTLNDFKDNLSLKDLYQIKYVKQASIDGTGGVVEADGDNSFYIGNVYLYNKAADDGKAPVITYADTNTTTVASASFRLRATDETEELSYKVVVKDKNGKTISNETVKGKPETDIYVGAKGLLPNTEYTATVTVSDNTRTSDPKVLNFTTHQLVSADKKSASSYYYENDKATLRGMLNSSTTGVDIAIPEENQISINADDKVLMFQVEKDKVFGLNTKEEFGKAEKDRIIGIAVYPVGTTTIQISPRIYNVEDHFVTRSVKENEWNYITISPFENYDGDFNFIGMALKSGDKGTVFLDNFYMYTSEDIKSPTVTLNDINEDDVHVNSVKVSFSGADETNEEVRFGVWVKNITDDEVEYSGGSASAKNNEKVTYYLKGLKTGKEYEIYVKVRDFSENEGKSKVKRFTTKSYTDNISIESSKVKADNGGIVVLKGKWDVEEFNKIAAEYPYGCFDVRNVVFDDGLRHDRGSSGIQLFNHNAYFITDIGNNFDGNYAIPDEEGKLIGMNFQWYDGDFKPDGGPTDYVNYQKIIADYKEKHKTDSYPGLSGSGYIKMDPYTGYDLYFKEQGASITRQMFMNTLAVGGTQGANKYSTMICPFAMNTDKVENCEFFQLNEPSVSGKNVTLNFTLVTGKTEANKPYLIRVKGDGTRGGTAYFVDNDGDTEKKLSFFEIGNKKEISGQPVEAQGVKATLFGTYVTQTFTTGTEPETSEVYGLKQDNDKLTLISSTKKSTLPAFRAAVKIEKLPANAKNIILSFDGETTGISSVNNEEMTSILGNVYSIDGKKVASSRDALVTLPAGIYIVNGKKVVIK